MPTFNNPAFQQGFENLAQMFAPPSGAEAAGWALANERNAQAKRDADAYERMTAPGATPTILDQFGIASGRFAPTQSFRAVDVESGDRRYATDTTARTTLQTNGADNARAVATNEADNARALDQTKLSEIGKLFVPLSKDQVRPAAPSWLVQSFGGPPGDLPAVEGSRSPLSETEWKAGQLERLRQSGELSTQDIADMAFSEQPTVEAVGPSGRNTFMTRGQAVRLGAEPAPSKPLVSVNTGPGGDGKLREKLDESEGKRLSDLQASAVTSAGLRQDLDLMRQLIEEAPQGPLVGRLAAAFPGFSDAGTAFQSIVERAAPGLRVEGSGATSDIEFRGMLNSLPALRNRPEANRLIAEMMRAKADVNVRRGELVTAYQNGDLDVAQMRQRLADLNRASVVSPALRQMIDAAGGGVEPLSPSAPATAAPSPGSIVDGFRFKGGDPSSPDSWEQL